MEYIKFYQNFINNKNFTNWFNNSIITQNGKPKIMYHGTKSPINNNSFFVMKRTDFRFLHGMGIYFTPDEGYASDNFAGENGITYECFLSLHKGFNVNIDEDDNVIIDDTFKSNFSENIAIINKPKIEQFVKENFDHIYMRRIDEDGELNGPDEIIVFDVKRIKSIHNNGKWNKNSADIFN
jgi:hypothetical protein